MTRTKAIIVSFLLLMSSCGTKKKIISGDQSSNSSIGQTSDLSGPINNDPIQFLRVYYTPSGKSDFVEIGKWRGDRFVTNLNLVEPTGQIKIVFDREGLISNSDFKGTISLSAEITGASGTRTVEVNPYSMNGSERTNFGISSISTKELANRYINFIKALRDYDSFNYQISYIYSEEESFKFSKIEDLMAELEVFGADDSLQKQYLYAGGHAEQILNDYSI